MDEIDEEIIALEENDDDEVAPKAKKKLVNAFMDGDSDAIDYNADDPEDEDAYEADPALSYDDENPDDEKNEVEAYDAEINEIAPDDLGEDVDLNEEDDEFQMMMLKRVKKSKRLHRGDHLISFFHCLNPCFPICPRALFVLQ